MFVSKAIAKPTEAGKEIYRRRVSGIRRYRDPEEIIWVILKSVQRCDSGGYSSLLNYSPPRIPYISRFFWITDNTNLMKYLSKMSALGLIEIKTEELRHNKKGRKYIHITEKGKKLLELLDIQYKEYLKPQPDLIMESSEKLADVYYGS